MQKSYVPGLICNLVGCSAAEVESVEEKQVGYTAYVASFPDLFQI